MAIPLIPVLLSVVFALVYLLSSTFYSRLKKAQVLWTSFSSGIFITYLFLTMFPEMFRSQQFIGNNGLFIAMWGFIILYILEKYMLKYSKNYVQEKERLGAVRMVGFFINNFMIGYALAFFFVINVPFMAYIAAVPLFFYMLSSTLFSEETYRKFNETIIGKLSIPVIIVAGTLISLVVNSSYAVYFATLAFIVGTFLYLVVRDVMPKNKPGSVYAFLWGVILYLVGLGIYSLI